MSPAVMTSLRGDLYLSLTSIDSDGISLEVYWFPFVWMVWAGGFLTAAGGIWSWLVRAPSRRRDTVTRPKVQSHA